AGTYKSTIKSYAVTVDGTPYTGATVTSNTLTNSGTITIKVVVTDSRGRTATVTEKITVATYSNPKITSTSAFRCASATDPTSNPQGEYICVQPRGSISPLSNQNGRACRVYYKKTGASSYSSVAVTMSDYVLDSEYVIFAVAGDSSYDIYTTLSDSFSSSEFDTPDVQTTAIPIDFLMDAETEENVVGIAVGKQVEVEEAVDFGWKTIFRKSATFYGDVYGQILMLNHIPDEVGENGNLNDIQYLVPGTRAIRQTATAKTISNIPQPVAGKFITYSAIGNNNNDTNKSYFYARQEFIPYSTSYGRYERSVYSSATAGEFTYGAWKRIAYTDSTVATATTAATANALKSGIDITVGDVDAEHVDASSTVTSKVGMEIFADTGYIDFHFANSTADYTARIIENSSGALTAYNSISSASDERLKKDFAEIPKVYLDLVDALNPELFRFKSGDTYLNVGLVAQKVLDMEAFFGITESVLVRGTGMEIPDPKDPKKVMIDYYSIDYQAYNVLKGMALERKMNRIISALGIVI
ncbi:MAG: tail fiber domain-containing protein, partial [Peptococcaceae bacterium]|nr:tail fiber domain-containing protein [Peptococcaceae bacterium]